MTKQDSIEALAAGLTRTANWRLSLESQYPDHRNQRSAKLLFKLADEALSLSDEQAASIDLKSDRWNEALRIASRQVGFFHKKVSLKFFIKNMAAILSASEENQQRA